MRTVRITELIKTTQLPNKICRIQKLQKRGTLRENVQILVKIQHIERKSSAVEGDTWNYNTIQKKNSKDHKVFYDTTLLVNARPIICIIDSGSPVWLIPNCLFNELTKVETLITSYKNANNQKIELIGQTKAMVKTFIFSIRSTGVRIPSDHKKAQMPNMEELISRKTPIYFHKETMKIPLLITRKTTTPLLGLDWMQWLRIHLNTNNS